MSEDVSSFGNYEGNSEFSHLGRNFGNPIANIASMLMFGNNYMPVGHNGQGYYDSFLQRQRTQEMFGARNRSFMSQPLFEMLGIKNNPMLPFLGMFAGSPDSMMGRMMSPIAGGNPMGASMQLFSGLSGANTMGNFGRMSSVSGQETSGIMDALAGQFYKRQPFEGPGGARAEYNKKMQDFIIKNAESPEGITTLKNSGLDTSGLGINGGGKLTEQALNNIKNLDFFSAQHKDKKSPEERKGAASEMTADYNSLLQASDEKTAEGLKNRLAKQLEEHGAATNAEIQSAIKSTNRADIKALIDRYQTKGEVGEESLGSKMERTIERNVTSRQVVAGDLQATLEKLEKDKAAAKKFDDGSDNGKNVAKIKSEAADLDATKALTARLQATGMSYADATAAITDKDTKKLDKSKVAKLINTLPELTEAEKIITEGNATARNGGKFRGFNFENSRGFKVEDFTSAFVRGAELRMLGDNRGMPPALAMSNFAKNGGGAMSAARSLIGDRSGGELMSFISDFAGKSNVDMGSEKGAGEIEQLLRKTKATAGVAGISIKAMLEIIKATKDLAANNPHLQNMTSSATTDMALKSAATAAVAAKQMTPADYRAAGGSEGILARDIREKQAYAQSPLAAAKASIAAIALGQGKEQFEKVKKILGGINSGTDLNEKGGMERLAKALNMDASELNSRITDNELLAQQAMGIDDIAKMTTDDHEKAVMDTFYNYHGFKKAKYGKDPKKAIEASLKQHLAAGGTMKTFSANIISEMGGDREAQEFYRSQQGTIERELMQSVRGEDDKQKIAGMIKFRQDMDTKLDKKFAGKNAPVVSQLLNAVMTGKDFGGKATADAIAGIFATSDSDSPAIQKIMKDAAGAGEKISKLSVTSNSDEDMLKHGVTSEVNTITAARRQAMMLSGDTAAASKLGAVSDDEFKSLTSLKKLRGASSSSLKQKLEALRKDKREGVELSSENQEILKTLETAEKTGIIESDQAIRRAQQGDLKGAASAVIQAKADYDVGQYKDEKKKLVVDSMQTQLEADSKGALGKEIQAAMKNYTRNGKVDYAAMLDDYSNVGKGNNSYFDKMSKEDLEKVSKSALGMDLTNAQDAMKTIDEATAVSQDKGEDSTKAMNDLKDAIVGGGGIATALAGLASALSKPN